MGVSSVFWASEVDTWTCRDVATAKEEPEVDVEQVAVTDVQCVLLRVVVQREDQVLCGVE